jgi:uncharacterized membrane protein YfcA
MNIAFGSLALGLGSLAAGFLGALTGLGGGVVIVPLLVLVFHIDMRYAIGASLVSVIATSSGAAVAYVQEGLSNIRLGMFLEIATTLGAISGAALVTHVPTRTLAVLFGLVLLYSAYLSSERVVQSRPEPTGPSPAASWLRLNAAQPTPAGPVPYVVQNVTGGFSLMYVAGVLSGLLGIGSGAVKVLAMDHVMRLPFKVSTATSNFMIGVTAAASAGIYLRRGYLDPGIAWPVVLGVLAGALIGARTLVRAPIGRLRTVFVAVIVLLGVEMLYNGLMGRA